MREDRRARRAALFLRPEEWVCAGLLIFLSVQGAIPGIAPPQAYETNAGAATALSTVGGIASQVLVNGTMLALILRRPRLVVREAARVPWMVLFALLVVASTAWSLDPLLTLRRSLPFALAGLFGVYFAARFSPARQMAMLRMALAVAAAASVAVVFFAPGVGLDHSAGHGADWQGIFTQKNACGRAMVLATAVVLFGERLTALRCASLALFWLVLAGSGSRGAWVVEGAAILVWVFLRVAGCVRAHLRVVLGVVAPVLALGLGGGAVLLYPRMAPLVGRDATLSGRTAIWREVLHFIGLRPWLGYGYDAFWRGLQGPSLEVSAAVHFLVAHAHNGFLEIALELGGAGLAVFAIGWMDAWRRLWPAWRRGEMRRIAWPVAVLVLTAMYDLDENTLLIHNGLFWVLYVAAGVSAGAIGGDWHHTRRESAHAMLDTRSAQPDMCPSAAVQEIP